MPTTVEQPKKLSIDQELKVSYCVPLWVRDEQVRASIIRIKGRLERPAQKNPSPIAIVCFGPSLNDTWEKVKDFEYIITGSGSHKFLLDHGVVPNGGHWFHAEVDPRPHKADLIGTPHKDVEYLIASCCHKAVFDLLEGYNVTLWHIFANDEEAKRMLPRGEWAVSGGSNVGLRQITLARFLGFTDLHIFGMDGCEGNSGKHAATHPMQPKGHSEVEYNGAIYRTTPSMLQCAKQTRHELEQLPDVRPTFYGDGLVQAMMKEYTPTKSIEAPIIALQTPLLISQEMRELNARLHKDNVGYGVGGGKHAETVLKLAQKAKTQSILDYGCGKGYLAKALPFPIWEYDPAVPEKAETPRPADIVVCTDVLEHIEPDRLGPVLNDLQRCTKMLGYFVINCGPAVKTYANGQNTHLIQKDAKWWRKKLRRFFHVESIQQAPNSPSLHVVVSPRKPDEQEEVEEERPFAEVSNMRTPAVKFLTASEMASFRVKSLLTKEPVTVQWIERMKAGDVLFDIGANMGGYSLWAAKRGVRVFAFEPSAQNYELLCSNIVLNRMESQVTAFCAALSNKSGLSRYASYVRAAGASGELSEADNGQGCITLVLDELSLPQPTHVKIDVDGVEPEIVFGAERTLAKAKTVLVEVNEKSERHQNMVRFLTELGFRYWPHQVNQARRKDGPFKDYAEYLFFREVDEIEVLAGRILDAPLCLKPFSHLYVSDIFKPDFYESLQANLGVDWKPINEARPTRGYSSRFIHDPKNKFWQGVHDLFTDGRLRNAVSAKFGCYDPKWQDETLLIKDEAGYKIGPHSDSSQKVVTCLFYLPADNQLADTGTSLYVPKEKGFTCPGGPHYEFDRFEKVATMSFLPNSLFAFAKTSNSFHGVEPIERGPRYSLLYDIRRPDKV